MGGSRIHCNFALHQLSTLFQKFVRARVEKDQGKKVVFVVVVPLFCGSLQLVVESKLFFLFTCLWTKTKLNFRLQHGGNFYRGTL